MNRDFIHRNRLMVSIRGRENKCTRKEEREDTEERREEGRQGEIKQNRLITILLKKEKDREKTAHELNKY